ncbi:N-acetylglucosaminyldiphosphoundecaprenol N-acetyl-beta-D-mannosaminyltransferase [Aeribacillus composti]|nr:N-acetylglucosaminyldiphosphoundecaprenol N-acetyl-beta-D-mannosaminyltransferase [Aeribacillus composti]
MGMTMKEKVNILGIPFIKTKREELTKLLIDKMDYQEKCFVVTANPEIVMHAQKDAEYQKTVLSADYIVPDGIGIIIASRIIRDYLPERVAGFDLMMDLLSEINKRKKKIFLLGAEVAVVKKAAQKISERFPQIQIVGYHHGYFQLDDLEIAQKVLHSDADLILVALGFPRQEMWISKYYQMFTKGVFIGVGGSFDVLAEKVKRAPVLWQKLNIEWLYRLIQQPSRWKRMIALPQFLIKIIWLKFKKNVRMRLNL